MSSFDNYRVDYKGKQIFVKDLPWYRRDRHGWPIETYPNRPVHNFIRITCQNIRKFLHI